MEWYTQYPQFLYCIMRWDLNDLVPQWHYLQDCPKHGLRFKAGLFQILKAKGCSQPSVRSPFMHMTGNFEAIAQLWDSGAYPSRFDLWDSDSYLARLNLWDCCERGLLNEQDVVDVEEEQAPVGPVQEAAESHCLVLGGSTHPLHPAERRE